MPIGGVGGSFAAVGGTRGMERGEVRIDLGAALDCRDLGSVSLADRPGLWVRSGELGRLDHLRLPHHFRLSSNCEFDISHQQLFVVGSSNFVASLSSPTLNM